MTAAIMDPAEAEKLMFQRMRLFMLETETIQSELDGIVDELRAGRAVAGGRVKMISDRLRGARSRLAAELGRDVA